MSDSLYVTASGALARLEELEVVANNLANQETTGFRADRAVFHATLQSLLLDPQGRTTPGAPASSFVETEYILTDFRRGSVVRTEAPLDVAIEGPGFFEIETPAGTRYTRAGTFSVNADAQLSTPEGHGVLGDGGVIQLGNSAARITASGEVLDARGVVLGRLSVVDFDTPEVLVKEGLNLFLAPNGVQPEPVAAPTLLEGSVERSNVNTVRELSALIILQRAFETTIRVLQADDQATQTLIREVSS